MEKVHKVNIYVAWGCIVALAMTTVLSYGMSIKTYLGGGVLVVTGIIISVFSRLNVSDLKKALVIILTPSYAILLYSASVDGNAIAYFASFVTLGMAVRYFNRELIKYYAVPYSVVSLLCVVVKPGIIDGYSATGAFSKVAIFVASSVLIYTGTAHGEHKIEEAEEAMSRIRENGLMANTISTKLNEQIIQCTDEVNQVAGKATSVKEASIQMEQVVEETSQAIVRVSDKISASSDLVSKNYEYASQLEQSFSDVNKAVKTSNDEANNMKASMVSMAETVGGAKDATQDLLNQMQTITSILGEINSIATQTNLLSLNASIEAARAGEHGRGFAVVAEEIRSLSEDSKKAADNIQDILGLLASKTETVSDKIEEGAEAAVSSANQITNLLSLFEDINQSAKSATDIVQEEYKVIESVKQEFDVIQSDLETVVATSEENAAMIVNISDSVAAQSDSVASLSNGIGKLKESSEELEAHFNK